MLEPLALLLALACPQDPEAGFDQKSLQAKVDEITPRVAELRGRPFKGPVAAGVHTPEQFIEFAKKSFEEEYGEEKFRQMADVMEMTGLIDPGLDLFEVTMELLRSQVGGYYDPATKTFYMISTYNQGGMADIIMAHELCHALDDQYYDLEAMTSTALELSSDAEFAVRAVVEGSGTSLMNLYSIDGMMRGYLELDMGAMMDMMEEQSEMLLEAPPYLIMSLALPYLEGGKFLVKSDNLLEATTARPTLEDIDFAFANPPVSSEQVLHNEKYWDPLHRDDPTTLRLPDASPKLGEGWKLVETDTLGELACFVVTTFREDLPDFTTPEGQLGGRWWNEASAGWDGDLVHLYHGPDGERLARWAIVWDSKEDRQQFAAALEGMDGENPYLRSIHQGADATVLFFADDSSADLVGALEEATKRARPDWWTWR